MNNTPGWAKIAAVLAIVFGIIGLIVGAWMFAPLLLIGIIALFAVRTRKPAGR